MTYCSRLLLFHFLHGLLGWLGFLFVFVKQKLRNFQRKIAQLGGVGSGGSLRSSDVYTKSRGVVFCLFLLHKDVWLVIFFSCLYVFVSVRVCMFLCVWWYFLFTRVLFISFEWMFCFFLGEFIVFSLFCIRFVCLDKEIKTILLHYD